MLFFLFAKALKKHEKRKTKRLLNRIFVLQPNMYLFTCTLYICKVYVCSIGPSAQFLLGSLGVPSKHLGSHPNILVATCSVCVCMYAHAHNTYTSTPCKKMARHFHRPKPSPWLGTNANHRPAGKPLLPSLFCTRMQWCLNQNTPEQRQ